MIVRQGPWEGWEPVPGPTSVTIGVLDGVHVGHQTLLVRLDDSMTRAVLTFDPHPVEVLRPGTPPRLITTIDERIGLLGEVRVDAVGVLDLGEIKEQSPEEFVERVLVEKLQVGHLVVGEDFRFGKDRAGDVVLLSSVGERLGFEVDPIGLVHDDGFPVSSSRIRGLIETGRMADASVLLGSWFSLTNTVIGGDRRGREIGYPTANMRPPARKVVPANGVYSCFAIVDGSRHDTAVNVGVRPTFGGGELLVEAYILDFDDDLYGDQLTLEFVEYIRPELRFSGVDELVARMDQDVDRARAVLAEVRSGI